MTLISGMFTQKLDIKCIFMTAVTGAAGNFIALSSKLSCNVLKILYVIFLWEVQLCTLEMEVSVIMENLEYLWASIIQQV